MVETDSFVRAIDNFVDTIDLESFGFRHVKLKEEGRPPYHPSALIRGKKNVLGEVSLVFMGYNLSRAIQITEGINAFKELIKEIIAQFCSKQAYLKTI